MLTTFYRQFAEEDQAIRNRILAQYLEETETEPSQRGPGGSRGGGYGDPQG